MRNGSRRWPLSAVGNPWVILATLALLAGQIFHYSSPLQNVLTEEISTRYSLIFPMSHLLATPFSSLADLITYNSLTQDIVWLIYFLAVYWIALRPKDKPLKKQIASYFFYLCFVVGFLAWAILIPRSTQRFHSSDTDDVVVDFHSHTSASWDGRRAFSHLANSRWHARAGYDAAFITDHNKFNNLSFADIVDSKTSAILLPGEELSLHQSHVVVLGNRTAIDPTLFSDGREGLMRFLRQSGRRYGALAVLSLPEYWRYGTNRWETLAKSGAAGFEIVSASPKALDFPQALRKEIIDLCRRHRLIMTGASDNHGWASAAFVWNVMHVPNHKTLAAPALTQKILQLLKRDRFSAVTVVTRLKSHPPQGPWIALDPFLSLFLLMRTFTWNQTLICLVWLWTISGLSLWRKSA